MDRKAKSSSEGISRILQDPVVYHQVRKIDSNFAVFPTFEQSHVLFPGRSLRMLSTTVH